MLLEFKPADASGCSWTIGNLPMADCASGAILGPEAVPAVFPMLLLAVVAARKMRQLQRHPYGRNMYKHGYSKVMREADGFEHSSWQFSHTQFCPICRAEYLHDTERCEDCAVQLVDEDDLPTAEMQIEEGIVRIASIRDSMHGHLLRSYFSSYRIPCTLLRCTPCDVFGTDVFVFESDAVRAKRLLRHFLMDLECC